MNDKNGTPATDEKNGKEPNDDEMKPSDYIELAKLTHEAFAGRRATQWRVNFAFWGGIVLAAYYFHQSAIPVPEGWDLLLPGGVLGLAVVSYIFYMRQVRTGHATDKAWKHYYMHRAENPDEKPPTDEEIEEERNKSWKWQWANHLFTMAIVLFVVWIAYQEPRQSEENGDTLKVENEKKK